MELIIYTARPPELLAALVEVWQRSVSATHDFLTGTEIEALAPFVRSALQEVPILVTAEDNRRHAGFMGIADGKLEMLFLSPDASGKGLGRRLVELAVNSHGVRYVDVNEQNPKAKGFYEHMGFAVYERLELDGQGNPFPLLKMKFVKGRG